MERILSLIVLIIIIIIGFKVSKKNYKNRTNHLNNNLLEYCCEIIKEYDKLNLNDQLVLKQNLTSKELELLNRLIIKTDNLGSNLNVLQTQMFSLEALMKKIRDFKK